MNLIIVLLFADLLLSLGAVFVVCPPLFAIGAQLTRPNSTRIDSIYVAKKCKRFVPFVNRPRLSNFTSLAARKRFGDSAKSGQMEAAIQVG